MRRSTRSLVIAGGVYAVLLAAFIGYGSHLIATGVSADVLRGYGQILAGATGFYALIAWAVWKKRRDNE